jgi:hypothetical protein
LCAWQFMKLYTRRYDNSATLSNIQDLFKSFSKLWIENCVDHWVNKAVHIPA